jgi:HPt (histidine-containing phosphotransfer) domain-containing protein
MGDEILNVKEAMARLGNNEDLYKKLLGLFLTQYKDFEKTLTDMVATGNQEELLRYVHTVKGVAGNLGADLLFSAADELNQSLKQGKVNNILIEKFTREMKKVIDVLLEM